MQRVQKALSWVIVLSECSHVFCCVLPTAISIMGLLAGVGLVSVLPAAILEFHGTMHRWELPMIALSGIVLALGWLAHVVSVRIDCHSTGCSHGPCQPAKMKASAVLRIASGLFVFNTIIYVIFHMQIH